MSKDLTPKSDEQSEGEKAALRIILRQVAPSIKQLFQAYANEWNENFFMIYLTVNYKEGSALDDVNATVLVIRSVLSKRHEVLERGKSEGVDQLYEFFPYMAEFFDDTARDWGLTAYDVYLFLKYQADKNIDNPEDSIHLELKTKNSVPAEKKNSLLIAG